MPQPFKNAVITNAGASLLTQAQAGEITIEFTRMVTGNGTYTTQEKTLEGLQAMTALKAQKNSYTLSDIDIFTERSVKITALITNQDPVTGQTLVSEGYYINEVGLYAKSHGESGSGEEVLYSIAVTAGESGDFMPPYNNYNPAQIIQEFIITVDNAAKVTIHTTGAALLVEDANKLSDDTTKQKYKLGIDNGQVYIQNVDLDGNTETVDFLQKCRKWTCPVRVGEWSRVLRMTDWRSGILRVNLSQNVQTLVYEFHLGVGYSSGNLVQISTDGFSLNSDMEIRIVRHKDLPLDYSVEILNKYGYQGAEYVNATLEYEETLSNTTGGVIPYTEYVPSDDVYNIVKAELTAKFNGVVAEKFYGDLSGTAGSADVLTGFAGRDTGGYWGNQTGECMMNLVDGQNGAVQFRKACPSAGKMSMLIDGYFYQNEGLLRCLDTGDKEPEHMGNNGTGGLSVGEGLVISNTYELFDILPRTTWTGAYVDQESGSEWSVTYHNNNIDTNILLPYMGSDLEDIGDRVIVEPDTIFAQAICGSVIDPTRIRFYFSDESTARNVASTYTSCYITIQNIQDYPSDSNQTILGTYNSPRTYYGLNTGPLFIVGNGTGNSVTLRDNALRLSRENKLYLGVGGAYNSTGADYAEFVKEWADGNPYNEDRIGYFVTVKDGLLHKAEAEDYIVGITSGNPCVVGNADEDYYWKYERDDFNRIIIETVPETVQKIDAEGNPIFDEVGNPIMVETGRLAQRQKIAEGYNPELQESYVERKNRKEWNYVGMCGVIPIRDDGTCLPERFCRCKGGGVATLADKRDFDTFFVLERISENVVSVQLKGL